MPARPTVPAVVLLFAAATVVALLPAAAAQQAGLPAVDSGARPGPDILYAPPPRAPQLENTGVWQAEPILVSGAQAYRSGEWLYQDFLYDDGGAAGGRDPQSPFGISGHLYSPRAGTYTYPTDPVFALNGADLVELRVRPLADATAFRVTLNTLQAPERTAFTIALGDSPAAVDWPHGAGVSSPAERFVHWHGDTAELLDAVTGTPVEPAPTVAVDLERRQVEVRVPHAAWDPGTDTVRTTVGVGLWDPDAGAYLAPQPGPATEGAPGGAGPLPVAIVNVAPRLDEPQPEIRGGGYSMGDSAFLASALATWWREYAQAQALRFGNVSDFYGEVDFAKLRAGTDDDSGVPTTGSFNRILASRFAFGQGIDMAELCTVIAENRLSDPDCKGRFVGQLHPYAVYVPEQPAPADGYGLTLLLHSLSANYNQYANSVYQRQLGERGTGSVVVTPAGRGPDGFYMGYTEAEVFEVWADAARHHPIDPTWVASTGYSMGGFGTYRLLARYPDLFGRGFSVVGRPGTAMNQLASLRHTPLMAWNAAGDELVHVPDAEAAHQALVDANVPHVYWLFATTDHLTLATNDEFGPGAEFLGTARADRDPPWVTYVVDPSEDNADAGVVADKAYWLSDLSVRDEGAGTIEAHSHASGVGMPEPGSVEPGGGALTGGAFGPLPYVERRFEVPEAAALEPADHLVIRATNVARVVVDPARAGITCAAEIEVDSDGPIDVVLDGCAAQPASADEPQPATDLPATGAGFLLPALGLLLLGAVVRRS